MRNRALGDKAYQGADKPTQIPKKKPKGGELNKEEKAANKPAFARTDLC